MVQHGQPDSPLVGCHGIRHGLHDEVLAREGGEVEGHLQEAGARGGGLGRRQSVEKRGEKEEFATKNEFAEFKDQTNTSFDKLVRIMTRMEQELAATNIALMRHDEDINKIKKPSWRDDFLERYLHFSFDCLSFKISFQRQSSAGRCDASFRPKFSELSCRSRHSLFCYADLYF